MKTRHASYVKQVVTALVVLWSMLFMQLAVAAYACPHASMASTEQSMNDFTFATSGCAQRDAAQVGLCQAQGDVGKQSVDTSTDLDHPVAPGPARVFPIPRVAASQASSSSLARPELARVTSPPLSIRYCCFRS
ncbi:hypothetical protein OYT13_11705 [Pandoraea sp. XJJ-1]|jgi:hypothetical protein|uniref:Uncharacterized protein n=2 Tax=Pandoraea TaxID=93217 RepID=A0A5E5P9Z3_9BURK|nr:MULTISPECIES: hypothetical protein [Pandoraea]MBN9096344.1 hypothetical protein [Pandoraea pnomenusa]OXS88435.1 hypothetical protein B7H01_22025 [Pandoraea apista]PTD98389.1 hypothetical protein C7830_24570 [Pandoraea apista]RSC97895.1 hypothetical protein EJB12_23745 [Pandoraea apista]RSD08730.1 hypothetical protein EIZ52_24495 [Pandoraea apista]